MIRIAQQVSRAIRILRGNRDESARASHLVVNKDQFAYNELLQVNQAETEKYSLSTFSERKIMKTAFKRVALVAAAAKLMGHSNPMVTLKIYTQVRDSEIMDSGTKITDFINQMKLSV